MKNKLFILLFCSVCLFVMLVFSNSLQAQENQLNLENKYQLARNYEQAGDYSRAESIYIDLLKIQPWNQTYIIALNNLYLQFKKYDQSIKLLENSLKLNVNDVNAYGLLGTTFYVMGRQNDAFNTWNKGLEINAGNQINYRIIANYALENRAFDKAIEYLLRGKEKSSDPKIFSYDLANIYAANMQYNLAVDEFCLLVINDPLQLEVVKNRIAIFLSRPGAGEAAESSIQNFIASSDNRTLKELLAFVYISNKNYDTAFNIIQEIDKTSDAKGAVLYSYAQQLYNDNIFDTASKCYAAIINNYKSSPYFPSAKIGFAKTLQSSVESNIESENPSWKQVSDYDISNAEKFEKVIKQYREIIETFPNSQMSAEAIYRLAEIKFHKQLEIEEAIELLSSIDGGQLNYSVYPAATELLGDINVYMGNLSKAEVYFQKAFSLNNKNDINQNRILFKLAKLYFWQGRFTVAGNNLSKGTKNLNNDFANDALELELLITTNKQDSLNLAKYASASFLEEQKKFSEASSIYKELFDNKSLLFISKLSAYNLAEMLVAQNLYDDALNVLTEIIENDDSGLINDKSYFLSAQIFQFALNNSNKAIKFYQNILEFYPNSLYFDRSRELIQRLNNKDGITK